MQTILLFTIASSWYIFLTYIYDERSHLHQIIYYLFIFYF